MPRAKKNPSELVLMGANPSELVVMGGNPGKVSLRQVKEAERAYASSVSTWGEHDQGTQRLHSRWWDLRRAYESQTGKKLYQLNPSNGIEGASQLYQEFHGEPGKHVDTYIEPEPRPANLGQLGVLRKLQVKRTGGWKWGEFDFIGKDVQVAGNVGHSQIYFVGGDQKVTRGQLTHLGVDNSKEMIDLGECMEIEYRAKKAHVDGIESNYYHQFGDVTGRRPRLMYDRRGPQGRLFLVGGEYTIEPEGIVN